MKRKIFTTVFAILLLASNVFSQISVQNLRTEMLKDPQGIDVVEPRLSWEIEGAQRGIVQTGFHILVASSKENLAANRGDLLDSGLQNIRESIH